MTPLKSLRKYCLDCCNGSFNEVKLCTIEDCEFFPFRLGKGRPKLKSIRKKCLECSESLTEVKNCSFKDCPVYDYRMGHNPKLKGIGGNIALFRKKTQPTSVLSDKLLKVR